MYVAFEGIDTAGKSTQIDLLRHRYPHAIFTKEPGGSELGRTLRELLLSEHTFSTRAEALLFLADRAEHIDKVIHPHNEHDLIISDRSLVSGLAYAHPDLPLPFLIEANLFAVNHIVPDLVIMLKLSPDELAKRLSTKQHDGIEKRGIDYLLAIQERMEEMITRIKAHPLILDAALSRDELHTLITERLSQN